MSRLATPPAATRSESRADRGSATSGRALPILAAALAVAILLPLGSTVFGVYDRVQHWGKLVHGVDAACVALIFGLLLLGWRQRTAADLSDELCALLTMFVGVLFGIAWELVEFVIDWVAYADLQKSNSDTMTDFLCNHVGTVVAALVAVRLFSTALTEADHATLGGIGEWLVDGPSRLLDRHGFALLAITACVIAAAIAALWFAGRPVPGLPIAPL